MDLSSLNNMQLELEDTFSKGNIETISITINKDTTLRTGMSCQASVRFSHPNGQTSGRHAIGVYDNPAALVAEIKRFMSSLK